MHAEGLQAQIQIEVFAQFPNSLTVKRSRHLQHGLSAGTSSGGRQKGVYSWKQWMPSPKPRFC